MITKCSNLHFVFDYIKTLDPATLIDVFLRPDDNDVNHWYVAKGDYQATWADERVYAGYACDAIRSLSLQMF